MWKLYVLTHVIIEQHILILIMKHQANESREPTVTLDVTSYSAEVKV